MAPWLPGSGGENRQQVHSRFRPIRSILPPTPVLAGPPRKHHRLCPILQSVSLQLRTQHQVYRLCNQSASPASPSSSTSVCRHRALAAESSQPPAHLPLLALIIQTRLVSSFHSEELGREQRNPTLETGISCPIQNNFPHSPHPPTPAPSSCFQFIPLQLSLSSKIHNSQVSSSQQGLRCPACTTALQQRRAAP